jgi:hypothetical protein
MDVDIKIVARIASILAEEALSVGLINSTLKLDLFVPEFAANINVSSFGTHGETNDEGSFDQFVGIVSHDFAVLASAWL